MRSTNDPLNFQDPIMNQNIKSDAYNVANAYNVGIQVVFSGTNENEIGTIEEIDPQRLIDFGMPTDKIKAGEIIVRVDPKYYRPTEVELLIGDATKANNLLGWKPKYSLSRLVEDMMVSDLNNVKEDIYLKKGGYTPKNYFE